MARDLIRETDRMNAAATAPPKRHRPAPPPAAGFIRDLGLGDLRHADFIKPTAWPTIDIVPSCANAAFVEFASAQYRHLNPEWSFFAAVSRYLDGLADDDL
jgi:chromosome partitioning protein